MFFTSTWTRLFHSVIPPSSYVPTLSPFVSLEKGQFSFDRFFHQDTESLPPFLVPWCFLGMVVLPTSQQLFDPTQNPHQQRPPYAAALLHTPSLINNNWLRQVLPHSSSDTRSSHAEYSAVDLLDVALEASTHATAPFQVSLSPSFMHADPVRKAIRTFWISAGLTLHSEDPRSLQAALTPWHFLWSLSLSPEGRFPATGLTCGQSAALLRNLVFYLNCILTNDDAFPNFPPGFSPVLLRGPVAGNLLWAVAQLENPATSSAWTTLASSDPSFALSLSVAILFSVCELFQQFFRWGSQNRSQICCPATADAHGFTTQCAAIYDITSLGAETNQQYRVKWRANFSLLFTHPTIITHKVTNSLSPVMRRVPPTYLLPVSHSPDKAASRRRPADPSSRDQAKNPRPTTPSPLLRTPSIEGKKAIVPLLHLSTEGRAKYAHPGKLFVESKVPVPRWDNKQFCFMFTDKYCTTGCTGQSRQRRTGPCNRHHVCLSSQAASEWSQASLRPLWVFLPP